MDDARILQDYGQQEPIHRPNIIIGKVNDYYEPIVFDHICYIESCLGKVRIVTMDTVYTCRHNLADLEEILPEDTFFRCHRAFIVNVYHIERLIVKTKEPLTLVMNDKGHSKITVSQSIVKKFRSYVNF